MLNICRLKQISSHLIVLLRICRVDLSLLKKVNVSLTPSEGVLGDLPRRIIFIFFSGSKSWIHWRLYKFPDDPVILQVF